MATQSRVRSRSRNKKSAKDESENDGEALPRALWSGSIAFGLVQIPVRLHTAEKGDELSFHQLDRRDHARIRYERVNADTGEKVTWDDIVKGYELDSGEYVVMEDEDFEKANVEATKTIDIQDFVPRAEIPPSFYERPYFVVPERSAKRAYRVLRDAMVAKDYVAIALVVLRQRQHLAAIMPVGEGLVIEMLRFADELKEVDTVASALPGPVKVTEKEAALAEQLVESLAGKWDPKKYHDTYKEDLLKAIEHKAKTGKIPSPKRARAASTNVTDLVSLLQRSVKRSKTSNDGKRVRKPEAA